MFSKKKETTQIDTAQRELFEYARQRVVQKKRLFQHFIVFLVGSIFLMVLNLVLGVGKDITLIGFSWFVTAILIWFFLLVIHACNVWLFSKFMGKEWRNQQLERLVARQKSEIAKIQKEVEENFLKNDNEKKKNTTHPISEENLKL